MPAFTASAPGKIILFGEHAVVYGQPAIAVPVSQVQARATVMPSPRGVPGEVLILAPSINLESTLEDLAEGNPIREAVWGVLRSLAVERMPACTLKVSSSIPVAAGLGSGAAVSVAVIRAIAGFLGQPLPNETVSQLAFDVEKIHHGNPSGIDNNVVTYAAPVYFVKDQVLETFEIGEGFNLVIGDTGISSPTHETVSDVRLGWGMESEKYERLFAAVGSITITARQAIEKGQPTWLGPLMDENHSLLQEIGVSSPELDHLVEVAVEAGAWGAKLSGGGRGGNMIALTGPEDVTTVEAALCKAGAVNTIVTEVSGGL